MSTRTPRGPCSARSSYDLTDALSLTGGLRYTDDDKDFSVAGAPANNRSVSDDHVSWDLSAMYDITSGVSVYGRIAEGFRGPSIQGRDVAFFSPPSVAQSETVTSFEAGAKSNLFGNTLRLNGAVFTYEVNDIQLTAVGGGGNTRAAPQRRQGQGDRRRGRRRMGAASRTSSSPAASPRTDTELDDPNLAVGICAQCTVTDPIVVINAANRALVDGNPFPNAPEMTADFTARWSMPLGDDAEIFAFTDWAYQGDTNLFIYESTEFQTDEPVRRRPEVRLGQDRRLAGSRCLRPQHHGRGQHQGRHRLQQQHRLRQRTPHRRRLAEGHELRHLDQASQQAGPACLSLRPAQ